MSEVHDDVVAYNVATRKDARSLIFHILYAAEAFDYQESVDVIIDNLNQGFDLQITHDGTIAADAKAIVEHRVQLDELYKPLLANWDFNRISVCAKIILRFGLWELLYTQTDPRIVINEAIELAKRFAEKDAYRFINGILDAVHKERSAKA